MYFDYEGVTGDVDVVRPPVGKDAPKRERNFWLNAWRDHLAGLHAYSSCLELADVNGDGDYKLIVADAGKRLKVFSGTSLATENALMTVPSAVAAFFSDYRDQVRRPNVAVASGPFIFVYKNLRPFYKFTLPLVQLDPAEVATWEALRADTMEAQDAFNALEEAKDRGALLSTRSVDFLACDSLQMKMQFVEDHRAAALQQQTVITAMTVLTKDKDEAGALGCLVVGTEDQHILILDSNGAAIVKKIRLPSVPVFLLCAGLFDVEYRVIIACRNGVVYCIKNGALQTSTIEPEAQPVAMARYENLIAIATMNNALHYYHVKGRKQSSIYMPCAITNLCSMFNEATRQCKGVVVALANGEVRVYAGKALLNTMQVYDQVTAMRYGRYGREDATLVIVLKSGAMLLKMLPRTVSIDPSGAKAAGAPPEQDMPLKVPKRTNVYVAQTEREKQFGVDMHRVFQHDLCRLRLTTAKAYVNMLSDGKGSSSHTADTSIRLTATVQGLGPIFKLTLNVQNFSPSPLLNIPVIFSFNPTVYSMTQPAMLIPSLVPSLIYNYEAVIECIDPNGAADSVKVTVCNPNSALPIITAIVALPPCDLMV